MSDSAAAEGADPGLQRHSPAHLDEARANMDLVGFPVGKRRRSAKLLVRRTTAFLMERQTRVNTGVVTDLDQLHFRVGAIEAQHVEKTSLWAGYAVDVATSLHTAPDHIRWMTEHRVDNAAFKYEDILEFWYSKLIPTSDGMIYDIGAHRGRHTAIFLKLARSVVAFEPTPHIRDILSTALAGEPNLVIRSEALCNKSGSGHFVVNMHAPEESGIEQRIYNDEAKAQPTKIDVEYARLDDIHDASVAIAFVKIDTEGGELDILRGGMATLRAQRPIVSVEYGFPGYSRYGHRKTDLLDVATELDYGIFDIFGFPIDASNYDDSVDRFCWDYILVPRERDWLSAHMISLRLALASAMGRYVNDASATTYGDE